MGFTKFATFDDAQVLDIKGSATRLHTAQLDKVGDYANYRTGDGFMYVRIRAISSRVNKNHDGWPSVELAGGPAIFERHAKQSSTGFTVEAKDGSDEYGFATFLGKPNFIDHNNSDPDRARGVVVDAKLRVLPTERLSAFGDDYWTAGKADPEHLPPTEVELLIEIDAQQFPKYAKAVRNGELDGFSMGCDVDLSKCSHCGHEATNPTEYCSHILMKGAHHDFKTADGSRISKPSYENCYGIKFFEISGVFEPADETALAREVVAAIQHEGIVDRTEELTGEEPRYGLPDPVRDRHDMEVEGIANQIHTRNPDMPYETALDLAQRRLTNPANAIPREESIEDYTPKRWEYTPIPAPGNLPPAKSQDALDEHPGAMPGQPAGPLHDIAEEMFEERWPEGKGRPVRNDPRWGGISEMSHTAKMRKGAPDPGDDAYFGGEAGSAKKAFDAMKDQYGDEKGEEVYYATRNKKKGKKSKVAEAEEPQSMHVKAPDEVDTLRQEKVCPLCGETMEGSECDVCGYEEPPEGLGNPDLQKAKDIRAEEEQGDEQAALHPQPEAPPGAGNQPPQQAPGAQGGSFLQTRNPQPTASVMSEMRWAPKIDEKLAGRINKQEVPVKPGPAGTGEPTTVTVVKNPTKPVTATMRTAQELIQATNQQGDTIMSTTHTADGATPPSDTSADARVDVTGVGGVIDASNEAASGATGSRGQDGEHAQVDVTGVGSTGVTDVDADETTDLPTASQESSDSGFNTDTQIEAIPTKTYDDSDGTEQGFTDPVTDTAYPQDAEVYKGSKVAYDSAPFYDQPGLSGGTTVKGVEPADPSGKAEDRVDVLDAVATPDNNSGPTSTWTGTGGNKVLHQEEPVTSESIATDGFTSHVVACFKLADLEVDLGLTPKEKKYDRISELEGQSDAEIGAQHDMLSRVRTAGLAKLAKARTSGVTRMPSSFGQVTAAGRRFEGATDGESIEAEPQELAEDQLDAALYN